MPRESDNEKHSIRMIADRILVVPSKEAGDRKSRAGILIPATADVSRRLVKEGVQAPRFTIRDGRRILIPVDFSTLPTDYPYSLMVPQSTTERVLLDRLVELGGSVVRPKVLTALDEDADGVTAMFDDGGVIRARYVVGADGLHSTVREQAGIGFSGGAYEEWLPHATSLASSSVSAVWIRKRLACHTRQFPRASQPDGAATVRIVAEDTELQRTLGQGELSVSVVARHTHVDEEAAFAQGQPR